MLLLGYTCLTSLCGRYRTDKRQIATQNRIFDMHQVSGDVDPHLTILHKVPPQIVARIVYHVMMNSGSSDVTRYNAIQIFIFL